MKSMELLKLLLASLIWFNSKYFMKKLLFAFPVVALLAAGCGKQGSSSSQAPVSSSVSGTSMNLQAKLPSVTSPNLPVYSGTLEVSDDLAKGNLMLVNQPGAKSATQPDRLYIKTQKDFSQLVGKKVLVDYLGTENSFNLANIVADNGQSNGPFAK